MSFTSAQYLLFLPAVLAIYWLLPRRAQNLFLLAASYLFYAWVTPWFALLVAGATLTTYLCALGMAAHPARAKALLWLNLLVCLGLLGLFKYADFFLENISAALSLLGLPSFHLLLSLALPLGISFFTFVCVGYAIDVYKGRLQPRRDLLDFALLICFFPTLQAGPIERGGHLLPQIENPRPFSWDHLREGLLLILWGLCQKLVAADNLALVANKIFAVKDPDFWLLWVGVLAFTMQILADFSGYTDLARGSARLLGFDLLPNFEQPYLASSPAMFWRRWHMSLSYWLRDYVYIPLGGSRVGAARGYLNILITFFLSGLWHGASWNFIIWGLYHGLLVLLERPWRRLMPKSVLDSRLLKPFKVLGTFTLVAIGWLMFRETDLNWLLRYFSLSPFGPATTDPGVTRYLFWTVILYSLPLILHSLAWALAPRLAQRGPAAQRRLAMARVLAASLMLLAVLTLSSPESAVFIYARF